MNAALYITQPGAVLRWQQGRLVVTRDRRDQEEDGERGGRETLMVIGTSRLETIGLIGKVHVTRDALSQCLEAGITLSWLTSGGRLRGRLTPPQSRAGDLRLAQYRSCTQPAVQLELARAIVVGKLSNAVAVLNDLARNHPHPAVDDARRRLRVVIDQSRVSSDLQRMRGMEGAGARDYFQALVADGFRAAIRFAGRRRRPAPDPANALLSFGYTLLAGKLCGLLEARGLDPSTGFYHHARGGRPALALDLLEEFRHPLVDRLAMRLCNRGQLTPEHFEPVEQGGLHLTREGLQCFFQAWHEALAAPLREKDGEASAPLAAEALLGRQVERFVETLRQGRPYRPFLARG